MLALICSLCLGFYRGSMGINAVKGKHMMKLFTLIFLFSFAHAKGMNSNALDSVFVEASLFIMLFLIMWIVSFFISRKHARKYEQETPLHERRAARRKKELIDRFLTITHLRERDKTAAILWLSKLLKKNIINDEEFEILKEGLNISSNSKS